MDVERGKKQYTTVLFDFDGTLIPSLDLFLTVFHAALAHFDVVLSEQAVIATCFSRDLHDAARDAGITDGDAFGAFVIEAVANQYAVAALFPHVADLLADCRSRGLATGLVTSSTRPAVIATLHRIGIFDAFNVLVTGDDVTHHKPHPEPIYQALAYLQRAPSETLMVGDSLADVRAGHAAGTDVALFLPESHRHFHNFDALHAERPAFTFTAHDVLRQYLQ